jgi:hypothetical protein
MPRPPRTQGRPPPATLLARITLSRLPVFLNQLPMISSVLP